MSEIKISDVATADSGISKSSIRISRPPSSFGVMNTSLSLCYSSAILVLFKETEKCPEPNKRSSLNVYTPRPKYNDLYFGSTSTFLTTSIFIRFEIIPCGCLVIPPPIKEK